MFLKENPVIESVQVLVQRFEMVPTFMGQVINIFVPVTVTINIEFALDFFYCWITNV